MKSKKLLISLAVVAVVVVIIVLLAAVFTVQEVTVVYHKFDGSEDVAPIDGVISDDIKAQYKNRSIVLLSKDNLLADINEQYPQWHAFAVVKNFPNLVEIHFVKRTAVVKFSNSNGQPVYLDSFGYVTETPTEGTVIDITTAFNIKDEAQNVVGKPFKFESKESNARLSYVLDSILATWQCYVDVNDMSQVLGADNVFTFDNEGSLVIRMRTGGSIVVKSPESNLKKRVIDAYGVYFNEYVNLQGDDWVITVQKNGRITTPSN